jgi:hypothetical protein
MTTTLLDRRVLHGPAKAIQEPDRASTGRPQEAEELAAFIACSGLAKGSGLPGKGGRGKVGASGRRYRQGAEGHARHKARGRRQISGNSVI